MTTRVLPKGELYLGVVFVAARVMLVKQIRWVVVFVTARVMLVNQILWVMADLVCVVDNFSTRGFVSETALQLWMVYMARWIMVLYMRSMFGGVYKADMNEVLVLYKQNNLGIDNIGQLRVFFLERDNMVVVFFQERDTRVVVFFSQGGHQGGGVLQEGELVGALL